MPSLGSTVAFDALRSGALDLYVDYTGTIWTTIMKRSDVPDDPAIVLAEVSRYLTDAHGITLVAALGFENGYALAMRDEAAGRLGVTTISELAVHAPTLVMAHCPPLVRAAAGLSVALEKSDRLPAELRDLVCLRVAQLIGCPF